jgi:Domain of unknown function (DUF4349)
MSEHRTDEISRELRATAPPAPADVRERVREIAAREEAPRPRRAVFRRITVVALAGLVVLTAAAALTRSRDEGGSSSAPGERAPTDRRAQPGDALQRDAAPQAGEFREAQSGRAALPPAQRLQDYRAGITLRVDDADDLSAKAQRAMREARRLGGFVVSVNFATESDDGTARLVLRVPIGRIQEAVAKFSELGTIVAQDVAITDLQPQANRLSSTIAHHNERIAELTTNARRTPAEEAELRSRRAALKRLTLRLERLTNVARYATVTVELTTARAAENEEPGAFGRFWDDASKILVTELIWLLYALVVAGPFVLLALLAVLAERARRRRSADALLAHH